MVTYGELEDAFQMVGDEEVAEDLGSHEELVSEKNEEVTDLQGVEADY